MSENTYTLLIAPSGRAKCKTCKEPIERGDLKILVESPKMEAMSFGVANSYHVGCFKIPRKLSTGANKITVEDFVEDYLEDGATEKTGGPLLPDKKEEVLDLLHQAAEAKQGANKKKGEEEETIMTRLEAVIRAEGDGAEDEPPKKKAKKRATLDNDEEEFQAMINVYKKYHKMKVDVLKDILGWNNQIKSGAKTFLLFKIIDGELHGRLGLCPLCQGDLKFEEGDYDTVHCRGRYDEDIGRVQQCHYTAPRIGSKAVSRLLPFYLEKPTQEQKEKMEKERAEARGEVELSEQYAGNELAQELLHQAEKMELDMESKAGKQKAVADILEMVKGKIDLPENRDAKMEIGKLVMAQSQNSAKEIMLEIFDRYGFKEEKAEKAAAKEAAFEAACGNPKNAPLILAFKECAQYYFKDGNRNAGAAYMKAIATLTDLEEPVTAANALSFSKGKTKLPGIGKGTAEKMKEFCERGTFEKLEQKRLDHA